jgi:DNA-directed RNA polymerase subunit RPC12/RpoP
VAERRGLGHQPSRTPAVDQSTQLLALAVAVAVGVAAILLIVNRQRRDREEETRESPFATSTEGEKRCPKCGMGNLWTETRCNTCGSKLPV